MLRKLRLILASVFFIGITLLFVGIGQEWWGWMAKIQFIPSCLALNAAVIVGITVLTLLSGRIYCSVICPLGVFVDSVKWLGVRKKKNKFKFHKEHKAARYILLGVTVAAMVAGVQLFIALIAPYSAYGRIVSAIVGVASGESVAWPLAAVAILTFVIIFVTAFIWGREYCNTFCPIGTVLSLFSRFALFRPMIDNDKCTHCHGCEKKCKACCIDSEHQSIDYSRCVDCFDCIRDCKAGAIRYRFAYGKKSESAESDKGRRNFIATTAILGGAALSATTGIKAFAQDGNASAEQKHLDGGLADVLPKQNPEREERLVPFGAKSVDDFYSRCTACQLCVSACPNGVLRPSTDLGHLLQPVMGYENGYCRPECTACSEVCPTGAILPITKDRKTTIHIGVAKVNLDLCVTLRDDVECGNCSRHCPVGAIRMVKPEGYKHPIPTVAEEVCIGCGACENLCPSRPISAITVNGLSEHRNG